MSKADFYDDDPKYDYTKYWLGREYENAAEESALSSLLKGKHFKSAVDIGGGYGRLCPFLQHFAENVTLVEPSKKQRQLGKEFLRDKDVAIVSGTSEKTTLESNSVDLITMIRVMHHLPNPSKTFKELHRVLSDDGLLVLEVANSKNFKSRIKRLGKGSRTPLEPVDIKTNSTTDVDLESPFVNHNPTRIREQLRSAGFEQLSTRSVSNFRSPTLKKILPRSVLIGLERATQATLAPIEFGPSLFILLRKSR